MRPNKYYKKWLIVRNPQWKLIICNYQDHIINNLMYAVEPSIPKIIHQIWLGSPLPERYQNVQQTWKDYHPEWQYILWTDSDIEALVLANKEAYDAAPNYGEKSDIARYEILYRFGGLYVDSDFECLQSFDIFHHCCDFYAGVAYGAIPVIYNGLIGAVPGHPILKACVENIVCFNGENEPFATLERTGPAYFTRCFFSQIATCTDRSVIFPVTYFYPWPDFDRYNRSREHIWSYIRPESYAVHHWHTSWCDGNLS
jgi:inositol phosphorylceramide mannosyltransferase catalytic subunit